MIVLTPAKSNQDEHHEEDDGKHLKWFLACWQGIKIEQLVSFCRKLHTGRNWYFGLCQVITLKTYLGSIGAKTSNLSGQLDCEGHYERVMLCFFLRVRSDFEKETRWRWLLLFMGIADLWQKRHHLWVDNKDKTLTTLNHLIRKQGENEGLQIVFDIKDV